MAAVYSPSMIDLKDSPSWQEGVGNMLMQIANAYAEKKKKDVLKTKIDEARKSGQRVKEVYDEYGNSSYTIEEPKEQSYNDLLEMMKYKEAMKYNTDKGIDWANMPDEVKKALGAYVEPKQTDTDINDLLAILAEMKDPSKLLSPEQISQFPHSLGQSEGGEVLTPERAQYIDGSIYSSEGERIGNYLPGYEPKPYTKAIPEILRNILGVSKEEVTRKALGLPKGEREPNVREGVLRKVVNGEKLNSGEQRVFEIISKEEAFRNMLNEAQNGLGANIEESLVRPKQVDIADWNQLNDEDKQKLIRRFGGK